MRNMVDGMMAPFKDKPQVAAVMNQMMSRMIEVDATEAATVYLEELPALARAQSDRHEAGRGQAFDRQRGEIRSAAAR